MTKRYSMVGPKFDKSINWLNIHDCETNLVRKTATNINNVLNTRGSNTIHQFSPQGSSVWAIRCSDQPPNDSSDNADNADNSLEDTISYSVIRLILS